MKRDRRGRYLSAGLARRLDRPAAGGRQRGGGLSRAAGRSGCCAAGEPDPMGEDSGVEPPPSWGGAADVEPGIGKPLTTGYCRLCHGKFSSRSLRNAFGKVPVIGEGSEKHRRVEQVFFADFQRLLGVTVLQDPTLPQFVCKNCHAQFYKCRSVLKTFLQRVNTSPTGRAKPKSRGSGIQSQLDTEEGPCMGQVSREQSSHSTTEEPMKVETSDISEGEDGNGEERHNQSMDESFSPCSDKSKVPNETSENAEAKKSEEPKEKKKPGPKPGWKNKFKPEREELPAIYKCPYQGCTAVYRGADGMKKHIKEHHEQVRERPCPHPGCNKVFMIDRYLQRHVKLIHTEERNYICDQCGQTFKQGKHLSVHQMRHSGAKPLQCEICGFQCRQRASLKYHMTKHKAEAELDFACDQCGKRFEKAHNLNVHMSMVHPLTQNHDKARLSETEQIISSTCILEDDSETCASQYVKSELTIQKDPS